MLGYVGQWEQWAASQRWTAPDKQNRLVWGTSTFIPVDGHPPVYCGLTTTIPSGKSPAVEKGES